MCQLSQGRAFGCKLARLSLLIGREGAGAASAGFGDIHGHLSKREAA